MSLQDFYFPVVYVLKFNTGNFMMQAMYGMFQIPSSEIFFGCCLYSIVLNAGTFCLLLMKIFI